MTTFYPSLVTIWTLRFDEALHISTTVPLSSSAVQSVSDALTSFDRFTGKESLDAIEARTAAQRHPRQDLLILQRGDKNASFLYGRVPKQATIELPGYRQAGTFSLTMDFRELPIDPRTVRSAAVEIHLGTVPAGQFGKGMQGARGSGQSFSVLDPVPPRGMFDQGTLVMRGLVDEWDVRNDGEGGTITVSGRDMRGILLDTPIGGSDPKAGQFILENLDLSKPINEVVEQLLSYNPMFTGFKPLVEPDEWPNGTIMAPGPSFAAPRHRTGARGTRNGARANPPGGVGGGAGAGTNYWDMIVRLCYLVGAIPYFVGASLVIRPARGIYAQLAADENTLVQPPFARGQPRNKDRQSGGPISGGPLRIRRLVYGRDVESFSIRRKLGGYQRPKTVRAVAVDGSSFQRGKERVVEARWPEKTEAEALVQRVAPSGAQSTEEVMNVPVAGVRSIDQLRSIARGIYEEVGRGELGGTCESPNLSSFGGDNDDPDLLRLKPGDAVEILVDTRGVRTSPPLVSTYTDSQRASFEQQVREVTDLLGDQNLARVIVATSRGAVNELQSTFRVSSVSYRWGADTGLDVSFDFQNYVEVRADVK